MCFSKDTFDVHWMQTRTVAKRWARRARPKPVATWDHIEAITTNRGHRAWGRLVFLTVRVVSVVPELISVLGSVTLWDKIEIRRLPHTHY